MYVLAKRGKGSTLIQTHSHHKGTYLWLGLQSLLKELIEMVGE